MAFRQYFLVGAFSLEEKSPTITVGSFFFNLTKWSTFYNFHDPLTATLVTSTGTWHRGYGFFEVCQAEGRGFEANLDQKFFCAGFSAL